MKLFVWDFHGVLEEGNERAAIDISNDVLQRNGYKQQFSYDDIELLYGRKWYEYFEHLLPELDHDEHFRLQTECVAYQTGVDIISRHIKPTRYAMDVLSEVAVKHQQILISNTQPESLQMFVDLVGMQDHFADDRLIAADSHRKRSKISKNQLLAEYLADKDFDRIVIIGDSPGDVALAEVKPEISVTYQYVHPYRTFRECEPDYRIQDLREVLREV